MGKIKPPKHKSESRIRLAIKERQNATIQDLRGDDCFLISFKHFDKAQSNTFKSWEDTAMLSDCLEVLAGYSCSSLVSQLGTSKFTKYETYPPNSAFSYPEYIPEDAEWARIHVNGTHVIAGHIVRNVFYVVFLDSKHQFWPVTKKHT